MVCKKSTKAQKWYNDLKRFEMTKISIFVRPPNVKTIRPYRLSETMSKETIQARVEDINNNFKEIQRYIDAKRNYIT